MKYLKTYEQLNKSEIKKQVNIIYEIHKDI